MAVAIVRCWNIKPGREKQARQELDKIYTIRRDAPGYLLRVELVSTQNPKQITIIALWKDRESADEFAQSDHTMSHLASMRRHADEGPLQGGLHDANIDLKSLPK